LANDFYVTLSDVTSDNNLLGGTKVIMKW